MPGDKVTSQFSFFNMGIYYIYIREREIKYIYNTL